MRRALATFLVALLTAPAVLARDEGKSSPAAREFEALHDEFEKAWGKFTEKFAKAGDKEERRKAYQEDPRKPFADRFLKFAADHPKSPEAVEALTWVVMNGPDREQDAERSQALARLSKDYADSPRLAYLIRPLGLDGDKESRALLKVIAEKSSRREVQGRAWLALATALHNHAHEVQAVKHSAALRQAIEKMPSGRRHVREMLAEDPARAEKEGEELFQRVKDKYADVKDRKGRGETTLGEEAEGFLYEIHHLGIGMKAPDAEAADLEGKKVRLSDLRGKVVVLDVWATWCGPCRAMIPHERAMVKKLEGKPFVLVSVSADDDVATLKAFLKDNPMPWTHWYSGRGAGLVKRWNVHYYPTIYVLDAKGVIRHRDLRDKELEEAVESLLKEADGGKK